MVDDPKAACVCARERSCSHRSVMARGVRDEIEHSFVEDLNVGRKVLLKRLREDDLDACVGRVRGRPAAEQLQGG